MDNTFPPLPSPEESGKGVFCAPVVNGVDQYLAYMIVFEDADRPNVIIEDREQARIVFAKSEMMGWNCYLFEPMKRIPSPEGLDLVVRPEPEKNDD